MKVEGMRVVLVFIAMRLIYVQQVGTQLALNWDDGSESFIALETLRRRCPCAACKGEIDVLGNLYHAEQRPLGPDADAFHLVGLEHVGNYAVKPAWADGHASGIYSFEYLRAIAGME